MKLELEINDKLISSALHAAGIGYWAKAVSRDPKDPLYMEMIETETDKHLTLDVEALTNGLHALALKYPNRLADIISDSGDSVTGDCLVQCCVFGELKYG